MNNNTLAILKPDSFKANNLGHIISMIEKKGFTILKAKVLTLSKKQAEDFYAIHKDRSFFHSLCGYMTSGRVMPIVLQKENAVEDFRKLIGATDPSKAEKGTIRSLYAASIEANAVHGSDSQDNAAKEINFFFPTTR